MVYIFFLQFTDAVVLSYREHFIINIVALQAACYGICPGGTIIFRSFQCEPRDIFRTPTNVFLIFRN